MYTVYFSCCGFPKLSESLLAQERGRVIAIFNLRYLFFFYERACSTVPKVATPTVVLSFGDSFDVESDLTNGACLIGSQPLTTKGKEFHWSVISKQILCEKMYYT